MTEQDAPTRADLEDLAHKLEGFGQQLPAGQQAAFRTLLAKAADTPDEVAGYQERSVATGRHVEPQAALSRGDLPSSGLAPGEQVFYVMGVPVFVY